MYHRRFDFVQVLQRGGNLHDDGPRLPLAHSLVLLEVKVEVVAVAVLEHGAKGVGVDLEHVVQPHDPRVLERLVDVVLSQRVPGNMNHAKITVTI